MKRGFVRVSTPEQNTLRQRCSWNGWGWSESTWTP